VSRATAFVIQVALRTSPCRKKTNKDVCRESTCCTKMVYDTLPCLVGDNVSIGGEMYCCPGEVITLRATVGLDNAICENFTWVEKWWDIYWRVVRNGTGGLFKGLYNQAREAVGFGTDENSTNTTDSAPEATCPTTLGPIEQFDGKSWAKVVNILPDRSHIDIGSTDNKLSDAQINSLRGSGLLRFVCDGTAGYVSDTEAFDSTAQNGLYKCGISPTGPFGTNRYGGQHRAIDCWGWNSGMRISYQHDGHTGCWGQAGSGKTGGLYVECNS